MRYIRKRRLPVRYRGSQKRKRPWRKITAALLALMAVWIVISEAGLFFLSRETTEEAAKGYLLVCVSRAVDEALGGGESSFVSVNQTADGQISAVNADTGRLNEVKTAVIDRLSRSLNGTAAAYIPIGSLSGIGVLNGRGPKVPVKLNLTGSADVSFRSEFISAGVNQSCHRITMTVSASAYSQSRRFAVHVQGESDTVLAETVLVGRVPEFTVATGRLGI